MIGGISNLRAPSLFFPMEIRADSAAFISYIKRVAKR
jgi:hypothetical protein